jgi:hypothetical protein
VATAVATHRRPVMPSNQRPPPMPGNLQPDQRDPTATAKSLR